MNLKCKGFQFELYGKCLNQRWLLNYESKLWYLLDCRRENKQEVPKVNKVEHADTTIVTQCPYVARPGQQNPALAIHLIPLGQPLILTTPAMTCSWAWVSWRLIQIKLLYAKCKSDQSCNWWWQQTEKEEIWTGQHSMNSLLNNIMLMQ